MCRLRIPRGLQLYCEKKGWVVIFWAQLPICQWVVPPPEFRAPILERPFWHGGDSKRGGLYIFSPHRKCTKVCCKYAKWRIKRKKTRELFNSFLFSFNCSTFVSERKGWLLLMNATLVVEIIHNTYFSFLFFFLLHDVRTYGTRLYIKFCNNF